MGEVVVLRKLWERLFPEAVACQRCHLVKPRGEMVKGYPHLFCSGTHRDEYYEDSWSRFGSR